MDCSALLVALKLCTEEPEYKALPYSTEQSECLTLQQARTKYPGVHMRYRLEKGNKCWGNFEPSSRPSSRSKPDRYSEPTSPSKPKLEGVPSEIRKPSKESGPPESRKPSKESGSPRPSNPSPKSEIFYPTLRNSLGVGPEMLTAEALTMWPLLIDIDEMFAQEPDPNNGIDGCCWPKLEELKGADQ